MCSFEAFTADREDYRDWWWRRLEKPYPEMSDEQVTALVDAFTIAALTEGDPT